MGGVTGYLWGSGVHSTVPAERRCQCAARESHGRSFVQDEMGWAVDIIGSDQGACPAEMTCEDLLCDLCRTRSKNQAQSAIRVADACGYRVAERV